MQKSVENFPERMKIIAKLVGNASKLASLTGISRRGIGDYVAGTAEPSRSRLIALAQAGKVSVEWLATGKEPRTGASLTEAEIDVEILEYSIFLAEKLLKKQGVTLKPEKKAQLIALIYEEAVKEYNENNQIEEENVLKLIKLAV